MIDEKYIEQKYFKEKDLDYLGDAVNFLIHQSIEDDQPATLWFIIKTTIEMTSMTFSQAIVELTKTEIVPQGRMRILEFLRESSMLFDVKELLKIAKEHDQDQVVMFLKSLKKEIH